MWQRLLPQHIILLLSAGRVSRGNYKFHFPIAFAVTSHAPDCWCVMYKFLEYTRQAREIALCVWLGCEAVGLPKVFRCSLLNAVLNNACVPRAHFWFHSLASIYIIKKEQRQQVCVRRGWSERTCDVNLISHIAQGSPFKKFEIFPQRRSWTLWLMSAPTCGEMKV